MAVEHVVRFVQPEKAGDFGASALTKVCAEFAVYRIANVQPVVKEGTTVGWMVFFERVD